MIQARDDESLDWMTAERMMETGRKGGVILTRKKLLNLLANCTWLTMESPKCNLIHSFICSTYWGPIVCQALDVGRWASPCHHGAHNLVGKPVSDCTFQLCLILWKNWARFHTSDAEVLTQSEDYWRLTEMSDVKVHSLKRKRKKKALN